MGTVWRAVQLSTDRQVALKIIRDGTMSDLARKRFEGEIRLAARLEHPNIATLYDASEHGGHPYYVMKLIDGVPLDQFLNLRAPKRHHLLRLMHYVCQAVYHAHQNGVVHRDLKPGNILVTHSGMPIVVDFGLARAEDGPLTGTQTGIVAGTSAYMAPEQVEGRVGDVDARTDVYALGAILYYVLLGDVPIDQSGSELQVLSRIANGEVRTPGSLGDISPMVEELLLKSLAKDQDDRYAHAGELADGLHRIIQASSDESDEYDLIDRSANNSRLSNRRIQTLRRPSAMIPLLVMLVITAVAAYFLIPRSRNGTNPRPGPEGNAHLQNPDNGTPGSATTGHLSSSENGASGDPEKQPTDQVPDASSIFAEIEAWRHVGSTPSSITMIDASFRPLLAMKPTGDRAIIATCAPGEGRLLLGGHHALFTGDPRLFNACVDWLNPSSERRILASPDARLNEINPNIAGFHGEIWTPGVKLNAGDVLILVNRLRDLDLNDEHVDQLEREIREGARVMVGTPIWGWKQLKKLSNEQVRDLWVNRLMRRFGAEINPTTARWSLGGTAHVLDEEGKVVKTIERRSSN